MTKNFVIVVDTQYDFMMPDGILYVPGAEETIVPNTRYLATLSSETTVGVLFTYDTHTQEQYTGSPESEMFPIHCEEGTKGHRNVINSEIIDEEIPVYELHKPIFDMWGPDSFLINQYNGDNPIEELFSDVVRGRAQIVDVVGVALNFCVKQAVDGLLARGFKVRLHTTMTRGIATGLPGACDAHVLFADQIATGEVVIEE